MCGSQLFGELHFWTFGPISSLLYLIVAPEVICVLKCQIDDMCLLGTWREVQVCFRLEQPNVVQPLSSASRYMLFGEYGSVFLKPGGLKNDQKVVVEEIRQRWMCCTIFKACLTLCTYSSLYFHITINYSNHEIHTFLNMKHFNLYSRVLHVYWTIKKLNI